jgi:hypothetical protein
MGRIQAALRAAQVTNRWHRIDAARLIGADRNPSNHEGEV